MSGNYFFEAFNTIDHFFFLKTTFSFAFLSVIFFVCFYFPSAFLITTSQNPVLVFLALPIVNTSVHKGSILGPILNLWSSLLFSLSFLWLHLSTIYYSLVTLKYIFLFHIFFLNFRPIFLVANLISPFE